MATYPIYTNTHTHTHNCIHVEPFVHEAIAILGSLETPDSATFINNLPSEFTDSISIKELRWWTRSPSPPVVVILGTKDATFECVVYSGQHFQLNFIVGGIYVLHLQHKQRGWRECGDKDRDRDKKTNLLLIRRIKENVVVAADTMLL